MVPDVSVVKVDCQDTCTTVICGGELIELKLKAKQSTSTSIIPVHPSSHFSESVHV